MGCSHSAPSEPAFALHGPEVDRLVDLFPNWDRAAIKEVLIKCDGDEERAVESIFALCVQIQRPSSHKKKQPQSRSKRLQRKFTDDNIEQFGSKSEQIILDPFEQKNKEEISTPPRAKMSIPTSIGDVHVHDVDKAHNKMSLGGPIPRPQNECEWDNPEHRHCWFNVPGESFDVRHGPNYRKTKTKAPSLSNWYNVVKTDVFLTNTSAGWIYPDLQMPPLSWEIAELINHAPRTASVDRPSSQLNTDAQPLPHHVIFTLQYPLYNPTMFKTQVDGEGVCCYAIAELKRETAIESVLPFEQQSNAMRLLRKWMYDVGTTVPLNGNITRKENDKHYLKVAAPWTKCIIRSVNAELPRLVRGYNGQPALHRSTTYRKWQSTTTLELHHTMHECLPYVFKKFLHSYRESTSDWIFECGILVEGESDEEQPERMLFAFGFYKAEADKYYKRTYSSPRHMFVTENGE